MTRQCTIDALQLMIDKLKVLDKEDCSSTPIGGRESLTARPESKRKKKQNHQAMRKIFMPTVEQILSDQQRNNRPILKLIGAMDDTYTPYALTFTFNTDHKIYKSYGEEPVLLIDQSPSIQMMYFKKKFMAWLSDIKTNLLTTSRSIRIPAYEVYTEFTKQGLIHAHGLLYLNNNYHSGVSNTMSSVWCNINIGVQRKSMTSYKKGKYADKAFDKCSDVLKWTKYITKEQSEDDQNNPCGIRCVPKNHKIILDYLIDD